MPSRSRFATKKVSRKLIGDEPELPSPRSEAEQEFDRTLAFCLAHLHSQIFAAHRRATEQLHNDLRRSLELLCSDGEPRPRLSGTSPAAWDVTAAWSSVDSEMGAADGMQFTSSWRRKSSLRHAESEVASGASVIRKGSLLSDGPSVSALESEMPGPMGSMREVFKLREKSLNGGRNNAGLLRKQSVFHALAAQDLREGMPSRFVIAPNSCFRTVWEVFIAMALVYDAVMIPVLISWNPDPSDFTLTLATLTLCFWICDLLLNCFTGFYSEGEAVMQLKPVFMHYLKTWFFLDLLIIAVDTVSLVLEYVKREESTKLLYQLLRFLKVNRMLRVVVIIRRLRDVATGRLSSKLHFLGLGTKLVVILLWLNHVICCMWFWIGQSGLSDTGLSWLDLTVKAGTLSYKTAGPTYQYFTALHWAMTQMTPGSMAVVPQNSAERLFNVVCLLVGLFVGALLVSQLSARMVKVQLENQEQSGRMANLLLYLRENNISWSLRTRIQNQIAERQRVNKRLMEKDVPLLKVLSSSLRTELAYSSFAQHIMTHTLFHAWGMTETSLLEAMCDKAVELLCLSKEDELFTPLAVAEKMYFVMSGRLRYWSRSSNASRGLSSEVLLQVEEEGEPDPNDLSLVQAPAWVSEVALWMDCTYSGTLRALTECELLAIHAPTLLKLMQTHVNIMGVSRYYCQAFCSRVAEEPMYAEVRSSCELVLMSMPVDWRLQIMQPLVDILSSSRNNTVRGWARPLFPEKSPEDLLQELNAGKCVISLGVDGHVQRTVALVTLLLARPTGEVLVRLAKVQRDRLVTALGLPGVKLKQAELKQQAVQRLLRSDLPQFVDVVELGHHTQATETSDSAAYGMPTKYLKTTFHASLLPEAEEVAPAQIRGSIGSTGPAGNLRGSTCSNGMATAHSASKASNDAGVTSLLDQSEVLYITDANGDQALYAWLSHSDFERLSSPKSADEVSAWLRGRRRRLTHLGSDF